jgi:hypothetical protein
MVIVEILNGGWSLHETVHGWDPVSSSCLLTAVKRGSQKIPAEMRIPDGGTS